MKPQTSGVKQAADRDVSAIFRPCVEWRQARLKSDNDSETPVFGFILLLSDLRTYPVAGSDERFLFVSQFVQQVVGHLHTPGPQFS